MNPSSCSSSRTDRVVRGIVSIMLAGFALSTLDNLWCAIPAGVCATFLMIGAVTGWCPTDLLNRQAPNSTPNAFGFPEAKDSLNTRKSPTKTDA